MRNKIMASLLGLYLGAMAIVSVQAYHNGQHVLDCQKLEFDTKVLEACTENSSCMFTLQDMQKFVDRTSSCK